MSAFAAAVADRYRIVREIGAGGMATVYLADDLKHNRQVAVKVLRPELAATMGPERFFREIQVAARLQHPHILPLHDSGEAAGFLFFVMPFVSGESLRTRLDRVGELPINDAIRILIEVADALSYSHSQGVVHRDIKPDNVMLSGRHALVTDFGVAKAVSEAASNAKVTTAGVALGTPAYMAPEQAAADPQLDHRVDIYAVGILGYELLAGRPPFHGMPPQQMLMAHVSSTPDPLRKHREACPPELEAVIMRCLAKRASDRWQTADELVHALEPLAVSSGGTTPTQTRPTSAVMAPTQGAPAAGRSRTLAWAAGAAVVAIAAWMFIPRSAGGEKLLTLERTQLTATGLVTEAASLSPDGNRVAYGELACDSAGYCTVVLRVKDAAGAGATTLITGAQGIGNILWSDDGRWLVVNGTIDGEWGTHVVPSIGGPVRRVGCCEATVGRGDTIVLVDEDDTPGAPQIVRRLRITDGSVIDSVMLAEWKPRLHVAWAIPGRESMLLLAERERDVMLYIADRSGRVLDSLPVERWPAASPAVQVFEDSFVAPFVSESGSDRVDLVRIGLTGRNTFDSRITTLVREIDASGMHLGRDGSIVTTHGSTDYTMWALERESPMSMRFRQRALARSTSVLSASIAPAGDRVLLVRTRPDDPDVRDISVIPFSGGEAKSIGTFQNVNDWDIAQDGRSVLLALVRGAGIDLVSVDIASGQSRPIGTYPRGSTSFSTLPGGGLVFATRPSGVRIVQPGKNRDTTVALPMFASPQFVEPSHDGAWIMATGWQLVGDSIAFVRVRTTDGLVEPIAILPGEGARAPAWLPDGSVHLAVYETWTNERWYRLAPGTRTPVSVGHSPRSHASYRFSRDGKRGVAREAVPRLDVYLLRRAGTGWTPK